MPHFLQPRQNKASRCFYVRNVAQEYYGRVEGTDKQNYCGRVFGEVLENGQCEYSFAGLQCTQFMSDGDRILQDVCKDFIEYLRRDFGCPALRSQWDMRRLCNLSPEMAAPDISGEHFTPPDVQENIISLDDWRMEDFADEYWFASYSDHLSLYLSVSPKTSTFYIRCYYDPDKEIEPGVVKY